MSLIAPDYPGFGDSDVPPIHEFVYTFNHLADVIEQFLIGLSMDRFTLYLQDYGTPVGLRIAAKHPEWIEELIVKNGNAYRVARLLEGPNRRHEAAVAGFFAPETTHFFYKKGTSDPARLNPDNGNLDQYFLDRPAVRAAHLELFYDYRNNLPRYPQWQAYFRAHQPRKLIVWGKGDPFFGPDGATAFLRDLPEAELHLLNTGHFALEEDGALIVEHLRGFLGGSVSAISR